jgi:hypothetical protein
MPSPVSEVSEVSEVSDLSFPSIGLSLATRARDRLRLGGNLSKGLKWKTTDFIDVTDFTCTNAGEDQVLQLMGRGLSRMVRPAIVAALADARADLVSSVTINGLRFGSPRHFGDLAAVIFTSKFLSQNYQAKANI